MDKLSICIYIKDVPEEVIKETLQHELLHVVMNDILCLFFGSTKEPSEIEEDMIRLISPRIFSIYKNNPKLARYIYE